MSKAQLVAAQIVVHAPEVRYCSATEATPEPASVAVALKVLVCVSGVPGSVRLVAGAVLSIRRLATTEVRV